MAIFLISLRYTAPLERIDALMGRHVAWLKEQRDADIFLAWGRKVPRDGGLILARGETRADMEEVAKNDPFVMEGAAEAQVIEWAPSFAADSVAGLSG